MTTLFEYINGVKVPECRYMINMSGTLCIYLIPLNIKEKDKDLPDDKSLAKRVDKFRFDSKYNFNPSINNVCIIFNNSIITRTYKGRVYKFDSDIEQFILCCDYVDFPDGTRYELGTTEYPRYLQMLSCWNVNLKINSEELKMLAFKCVGMSESEIMDTYGESIDILKARLKITTEAICQFLMQYANKLDYYDYANTPETNYFSEDPILTDLVKSAGTLKITYNSRNHYLPALIYTIKQVNPNCAIYIESSGNEFLFYRFELNSLNTETETIPFDLHIVFASIGNISVDMVNMYPNTIIYSGHDSSINSKSHISTNLIATYEPVVVHANKPNLEQQDTFHLEYYDMPLLNITGSVVDLKTYHLSSMPRDGDINSMYSLKRLQMVSRMIDLV